jgi:peptidyl-tRNA hydrolase
MNNNIKLYIIVNDTLKMTTGKIISQCCHSVVSMNKNKFYKSWISNNQPIVVLKASENVLYEIINNIKDVVEIYDMGLTQVSSGSLTCISLPLSDTYPAIIKNLKIY